MTLKIILVVAAFVSLSAVVAYLYGSSLLAEHSISRSIFVNADPKTVYDLAMDAKGQSSWRQDVSDITMSPDNKGWVEHTKQGDIKFEIIDANPPHTFSLSIQGPSFHGKWVGNFTPGNSGTEVSLTETITIKNPFFRLLSKMMKFTEKFMDTYARELKTEAEKRQNPSAMLVDNPTTYSTTNNKKEELNKIKITRSAQYDDDGKHDKTYIMSADRLGRIGKAKKFETSRGHTVKFTFTPDSNSPPQLTACEARTMEELKAKIRKQLT